MSRLMKRLRAAALGAVSASALVLAAGSANAQYYPVRPMYPPPPPPYEAFAIEDVDAVLRSLGLTPLSSPSRRGPFLVVRAMGQEGTHVHVMLDRRTGQVVHIVRAGPGAPRVAVIRPDAPPTYQPDDDEAPGAYEDDTGYVPLPPSHLQGPGGSYPGAGPRVVTREPEITGSVPRSTSRQPVDPLLGVPKEFRGPQSQGTSTRGDSSGAKLAARTPADTPRATPLPRPRPADAPAVAQRESAPAAKPGSEKQPAPPPAAKPPAKDEYPVQPLE